MNRNQLRWLLWLRIPRKILNRITMEARDTAHVQTAGLWISAVLASLIAVGFAKLFRIAETGFFRIIEKNAYAPLIITPLLFLISAWIVRKFAPEAAGSGIPQIMAANEMDYTAANRPLVDRLLSLKTAIIKVISSLLCVLGGGAIGREGPTLQISASVFHFFGQQVRKFVPNLSEHTWVVAGAASGLAAAFNTPLGGIVYAIEELGIVHFHKIRTALLSGVIVSGIVAQWILGSYLYLGFPGLKRIGISFLPLAALNGIISGLAGACFGKALMGLLKWRAMLSTRISLVITTLACGFVMATLILYEHKVAGPGIELVTGFLFSEDKANASLILTRTLGTIVSYLSGAAGGIFSPSLSIGATIGSYLASLFGGDHTNLMVLLGMIGFLTGVTRTPFTSFILVLEMTDRHSAIFPMMLAALTAQGISQLVDKKSFYEHVKEKYVNPW